MSHERKATKNLPEKNEIRNEYYGEKLGEKQFESLIPLIHGTPGQVTLIKRISRELTIMGGVPP